jgi:hypothetical protein
MSTRCPKCYEFNCKSHYDPITFPSKRPQFSCGGLDRLYDLVIKPTLKVSIVEFLTSEDLERVPEFTNAVGRHHVVLNSQSNQFKVGNRLRATTEDVVVLDMTEYVEVPFHEVERLFKVRENWHLIILVQSCSRAGGIFDIYQMGYSHMIQVR